MKIYCYLKGSLVSVICDVVGAAAAATALQRAGKKRAESRKE